MRFLLKQGHLQPHFHSEARQLTHNCKMVYLKDLSEKGEKIQIGVLIDG